MQISLCVTCDDMTSASVTARFCQWVRCSSAACSMLYNSSRAMGSFCLANSRCLVRQILPGFPSMLSRQYSLNISAELLRTQSFINGRWVSASSTFPVLDPASGKELAQVSDCGPQQAQEAVSAANKAFYSWRSRTAKVKILKRFSSGWCCRHQIWFTVVTHLSEPCSGMLL